VSVAAAPPTAKKRVNATVAKICRFLVIALLLVKPLTKISDIPYIRHTVASRKL
jgi:hypothetical protein